MWLRSSWALQPQWDLLWSAQPWDLPVLPRCEDGVDRLQRKITLEIPTGSWLLFSTWNVFPMACPAGSWFCPADPQVLSSHIPVLASCCSLTKPPLKVPDALGPHTCLAPLGTCRPCPDTCSAPVVALQTWDSSYALSLHLSQIFYFFQCQRMSVLEPRPRPGSTRPVGPWDSSLNPVCGEVAVGAGWYHHSYLGGWKGSTKRPPALGSSTHSSC